MSSPARAAPSSARSFSDIKTGRVVDYTFNAGTKFDTVRLETT